MRALVTGGRWFNLNDEVHRMLGSLHERFGITELAEGGATGADELSKLWALSFNIPVRTFDANWKTWGNRAGNVRNAEMLREFGPDIGVAFPGGEGTRDMRTRLIHAKIPTLVGTWTNENEVAVRWTRVG